VGKIDTGGELIKTKGWRKQERKEEVKSNSIKE
jgi:hypothetical protein